MRQPDFGNQGRRTIEWEGRDIISVLKDMGVPYNMENSAPVCVKPMPSSVKKIAMKIVKPKACFYNASMILSTMCRSDIKYVVGFASAPVPFEHAWIKVENTYYDPTWEIFGGQLGSEYLPLHEMRSDELFTIMALMETSEPPDLQAMHRLRNNAQQAFCIGDKGAPI